MNRRERVINTLNHIQPDHVPYNIFWTKQEYDKIAVLYNYKNFNGNIGNCIKLAGG